MVKPRNKRRGPAALWEFGISHDAGCRVDPSSRTLLLLCKGKVTTVDGRTGASRDMLTDDELQSIEAVDVAENCFAYGTRRGLRVDGDGQRVYLGPDRTGLMQGEYIGAGFARERLITVDDDARVLRFFEGAKMTASLPLPDAQESSSGLHVDSSGRRVAVDRYTPQDTSSTVVVELNAKGDPAGDAKEHPFDDLGEFVAFTQTGFIQSVVHDELYEISLDGNYGNRFFVNENLGECFVEMPFSVCNGYCAAVVEPEETGQPSVLLLEPGFAGHRLLEPPGAAASSLTGVYLLEGNTIVFQHKDKKTAVFTAYDLARLLNAH